MIESLDVPIHEDKELTRAEVLVDHSHYHDESYAQTYRALYEALEQLSEERRRLLACRFGLLDEAPTPLRQLAREWFPHLPEDHAVSKFNQREKDTLLALKRAWYAASNQVSQLSSEECYTAEEVQQLAGVSALVLRRWVRQGTLMEYPAPAALRVGSKGGGRRYVYAKTEVDVLVAEVQAERAAITPVPQEYYTTQEVAERAGVSRGWVRGWARAKRLQAYELVRKGSQRVTVYDRVAVDACLLGEQQEQSA